jgi:hypothetical protein
LNRAILAFAAVAFALAACGSAAGAAGTSSSPSPGAGSAFRNGASGQLVQVNGQTLILTGPNGDTTVTYTPATTFTKTSQATLADITRGTCILATGVKDASGALTATNVRLSPKTATGCAVRNFAPTPAPGATPRAGATPRPNGQPNAAFVTGEVAAVAGTSVTVLTQTAGNQTITVATAASITRSAIVSGSALQDGECVRANGTRDSAGDVQAVSITITPAGPSGTCTTGFGGRGGGGAFPGGGASGG